MPVQDYHNSPITRHAERCKANIACPYGVTGPITTPSGIPVQKGQTFNQARRQHQKQQMAKNALAAKHQAETHMLTEAEIVERMFSMEERDMYYATRTLCNYDNARGHDDKINSMLCQLKISHPHDFVRLSKGFDNLSTVAEKKKTIKDCFDFYQKDPTGVYKNFPRLSDDDLNLQSREDDKYSSLWYYADRSGDPTLQSRVEYITRNHPEKIDILLSYRGDFASDEEFEQHINESYAIWVEIDKNNRERVRKNAMSERFVRRANALVTFFRKLAVVRNFEPDSKLAQSSKKDKQFDGSLFGGGWLLFGNKLYKKNASSDKEIEENVEKARKYL